MAMPSILARDGVGNDTTRSGKETIMQQTRRRANVGALVLVAVALGLTAGFVLGMNSPVGASSGDQERAAPAGIPRGYAQVDPRNPARSQQVFLGQRLSDNAPIFPGDPRFKWQLWNCVRAHPRVPRCHRGSGYTLEQIQSLGTHTGTHISAPCHFHENKPCLDRLREAFFGLRPLMVIDVKPRILARRGNGDFFITASYIQNWLQRTGCRTIPQNSYVVLYTGLSSFYHLGNRRVPGRYNDYYDSVPGFSTASTRWLWEHGAIGVGADTFGPDATMDQGFGSTTEITALGGITLENMGPGLARMRPCGDWIELNGPRLTSTRHDQLDGRLDFSGAWMGMDGWTLRTAS
jgi:kynurenine formamidase